MNIEPDDKPLCRLDMNFSRRSGETSRWATSVTMMPYVYHIQMTSSIQQVS